MLCLAFLFFVGVQLLYNVVLVSTVQQHKSTVCMYIYIPSLLDLLLTSSLSHPKWAPSAIQQLSTRYLFYTWSVLASRITWREEPGGLQSTGSQRVRHNWSSLAGTSTCTYANAIVSVCPPSPSSHLQGRSLHLHLYSCPENRCICTIICINRQYLFFLFLTYFTLYDRL